MSPKKVFEFGGYAAAAILVAFGIGALVMGVNGRSEVRGTSSASTSSAPPT